jgi:hypothetical protein
VTVTLEALLKQSAWSKAIITLKDFAVGNPNDA